MTLYNSQISKLNGETAIIPSCIKMNGSWIPTINIKDTVLKLTKIAYLYNFVILKNDEYKKIVVAFPGSSTYLQILDELYSEKQIEIFLELYKEPDVN